MKESAAIAALVALQACAAHGVSNPGSIGLGARAERPVPIPERPADVSVVRVVDVGSIRESPSILARDGGISSRLDGKSVWLFGDTIFRRQHGEEIGGISNSWAWTEDADARDGIDFVFPTTPDGDPAPFLPETRLEREFNRSRFGASCSAEPCGARWALWPLALIADPERARRIVFYANVYARAGEFDFAWMGNGVAVWDGTARAPVRLEHGTAPVFRVEDRAYGNAAVRSGDDLYVYGCSSRGLGIACRVARTPLRDVLDVRTWRYYAGSDRWSDAAEDARPVLEANFILSVAYNTNLSEYLAVYSRPLTNDVMVRTAKRPEGPWSTAVRAFTARKPARNWVYDAQAHPELERENGRIQYVTYSITKDATKGEMRLVEIELAAR
jgi:hypothetical protein